MLINAINTTATVSRAYLEEPRHMHLLDQQSMRSILCILLGFLKKLPQSENLVRGAAT